VELRVLGTLDVVHHDRPAPLRGTKARQLLALLALRPNRVVASDQLIDELWDGDPPPTAATALRVHVGRVRDALEPERSPKEPSSRLPAGPLGYVLRVEPDELDAQQFERLVVLGRDANADGDPRSAVAHLQDALTLWRGPAYDGLAALSAVRTEVARLDGLRSTAIDELASARLARGEHEMAVDLLVPAIHAYPLQERLTGHLMLALYRGGRQSEALRAFAALRDRLDELGVPPSHDLRQLESRILLQDPTLDLRPARNPFDTAGLDRGLGAPRFVGRRRELQRLLDLTNRAGDGVTRCALVAGPAGIGKTTLVEQFAGRAAQRGTLTLVGHCEEQRTKAEGPVIELLRELAVRVDAETRDALPPSFDDLVGTMRPDGARDRAGVDDAAAARFAHLESIASALRVVASRAPLVLVVEDVHWADRPTLSTLRYLLRHPDLDRVFVVVTLRDDELSGEQHELVNGLAPPRRAEIVTMRGFDDNEVRALIRATAAPDSMQQLVDLATTVHDVTNGNPFFIRELLRELDDQPTNSGDPLALAQAIASIAPAGVRALLDRRVARLSDPSRYVLQMAATLDRELSTELLTTACRLPEDIVLDALEELLAVRLLAEDGVHVGEFTFSHAVVRNVVYENIPGTERARLHLHAGEAVERCHGPLPERSAELALHFGSAVSHGTAAKAAVYANAAGNHAVERHAFGEAVRWFDRALHFEQMQGDDPTKLGPLHLRLGLAHEGDGQLAPARESYLEAAACARATGNATLLADAATALAGPWSQASAFQPRAIEHLDEALAAIGDTDTPRRVQLLNSLAAWLYYADVEREDVAAHEALALAESLHDRAAIVAARIAVHRWLTHQPRAREERLAFSRQSLAITQPSPSPSLHLRVYRELLTDLLENGLTSEFDTVLCSYERQASELCSPRDTYWAMALRATQATLHGDLSMAEQLARGAEMRGTDLEHKADGAHLLQRFVIRYQQGRLPELGHELRGELQAPTETSDAYRAGLALAATAYAETGNAPHAVRIAWRALGPDGSALRPDVFWLAGVALFAGVAATAGDQNLLSLLDELLLPCGDHLVLFGACGAVLGFGHHWLGRSALASGRGDDAIDHLERARARSAEVDAPFWEAQAALDLAAAFEARDRFGDRARAAQLTSDAHAVAQARGFGRLLPT
jgi:DNA-binding SARP family transcriptional activator/tetratricopeptide (TPR) repeat protein